MKRIRKPQMRKSLFYFSIIFYLLSFLFFISNSDSVQTARSVLYNSDMLFPISFYKGILHPVNTDWVFSGLTPYFPDFFFGFIFWALFRDIHLTLAAYALFQVTFLAVSMLFLSKCIFGKNYLIYSLVMIFSSIPLILFSTGDMSFVFILSWHIHSSVIGLSFFGLGLLIQLIKIGSNARKLSWKLLVSLCLLTMVAVGCDMLFISQFVAPAIAVLVSLVLMSKIRFHRMILIVISLLISAGIGISSYNLPELWGSGRKDFSSGYFNPSWDKLAINWKDFIVQFSNQINLHSWKMVVWSCFYAICLIIAVMMIRGLIKDKSRPLRIRSFVLLIFWLFQLPVVIGALVISGSTINRYFEPIVFIPVAWGWPFILGSIPGLLRFIRQKFIIACAITYISITTLAGLIILDPVSSLRKLTDYYPDSVACVDQQVGALGLRRGIAQYWRAYPLTYLSKEGVVVVQVDPDLYPFRIVNNSDYYQDDFEFIVVDEPMNNELSISKVTVLERFGEPAMVLSCPDIEILVYNRPGDILFRTQFDMTAVKLVYSPDDTNLIFLGRRLPSQRGSIEEDSRVAKDGDGEGYLTTGPYLHITPGAYHFQIDYKTQPGPHSNVNRWDVSALVNGDNKMILEGELALGTDSVSGDFMIERPTILEIRTYYSGSGVLTIDRISINGITETNQ
jgi:hypothetical protein